MALPINPSILQMDSKRGTENRCETGCRLVSFATLVGNAITIDFIHHPFLERNNILKKTRTLIAYLALFALMAALMACASTPKQQGAADEFLDESAITSEVESLLATDELLRSFQISVETYKGIVQLSGVVDSQQAVNQAGDIARSVEGVTSVDNALGIK